MSQKLNLEGHNSIHDPRALVEIEAVEECRREVSEKIDEEVVLFRAIDRWQLFGIISLSIIPDSMLMPRTGA
jgi:hypothetical protein